MTHRKLQSLLIGATSLAVSAVTISALGLFARADDVTYFEKDGITYRETRQKIQRPVTDLRMVQLPQTVRTDRATGAPTVVRSYMVPVTEYTSHWRLVGRWNPFVRQPHWEQRQVPVTRWELKSDNAAPPVNPPLPAGTSTVASTRMVEDEIISRVAVGTRAPGATAPTAIVTAPSSAVSPRYGAPPAAVASRPANIGGISKLDSDPPRVGNNVQWRPADVTRR